MKRRLLIVVIVFAFAIFFWWLAPSYPALALTARYLCRTNWPGGGVRYIIAVTNGSRAPVEVKMSNALMVSIGPTSAGTNQISLDHFRLVGGEDAVLAWASTNVSPRTATLVYSRRSPLPAWKILLFRITGFAAGKPTERFPDPQTVVVDLPRSE